MTTPSRERVTGAGLRPDGRRAAERLRSRLAVHFAVVLLAAGALAGLVGGAQSGISAGLGALLGAANLLAMRRITAALASPGGGSAAWVIVLPFKLVALVGVAYALVAGGVALPLPLAVGFALVPLSSVFLPRPRDGELGAAMTSPAASPAAVSPAALSPGPVLPGRAGNP